MSRDLKTILIILFLLALVISPVAAQDETTEEPDGITVTIPGDGDGDTEGRILPYEFLGLVALVIVVLIYSAYQSSNDRKLHLEAVDKLFKSTPPFIRDPAFGFVSGVGDNIMAGLDELARATTWTNLDNEAQAEAARLWQETKDRWRELSQDAQPFAQIQFQSSTETTLSDATIAEIIAQLVNMGAIPAPEVNTDWRDPGDDDPNLAGAAGRG